MDAREFRSFVNQMRQLFIDKHRSDFQVGSYLVRVREGRLYERWPRTDRPEPGYANFAEFCDRELGYSLSQATQKANNYEKLVAIGLREDSDTFSRCMRLGYSKLNVLLRVAVEERGLVQWLNDIEGRNLTELQLRSRVMEARQTYESRLAREAGTTGARGDRSDADAPHSRRTPPVPAAPPPETPEPPAHGTTRGYVEWNVRVESPEARDAIVRTVDMMRRRYGNNLGVGRAIEMMALHYLATAPTTVQGGAVLEVENLIRAFESAYGIQLQVVTPTEPAPRRRRTSRALRSMRDGPGSSR